MVTIITGASRGIGRATALKLADEGHDLALFGRDEQLLKKVAEDVKTKGVKAEYFTGNIANYDFVETAVASVEKTFGPIDNLVNNAGLAIFKKLDESTPGDFRRQFETNVMGIYNFCKMVAPSMKERKSGAIINISSLAGKHGFPGSAMYTATKHAVMGFSKSLLLELRQFDIKVSVICPGSVVTDMIMGSPIEPKDPERILHPDDVAETVSLVINMPPRANVSEIDIRPTNP